VDTLRAWRVLDRIPFDWSRVDIPMTVSGGLFLDYHRLHACLNGLAQRQMDTQAPRAELRSEQMHFAPDKDYARQRRRALKRVENLGSERGLDPSTRSHLRLFANKLLFCERYTLEGLAAICSKTSPLGSEPTGCSAAPACEAFLLIQRSRIVELFFLLMSEKHQESFPNVHGRALLRPLASRESAETVYGRTLLSVDVSPPGGSSWHTRRAYIPTDSPEAKLLERTPSVVIEDPVEHMSTISWYLVPQALDVGDLMADNNHTIPSFSWNLQGCEIRRATGAAVRESVPRRFS
jgi:hypothetical protein